TADLPDNTSDPVCPRESPFILPAEGKEIMTPPLTIPLGTQEGSHVKTPLSRIIAIVRPDGTGAAGQAAAVHASLARPATDVPDTGRHVVAPLAEGPDRAGGQAGLLRAAVTGPRPLCARRQGQPFGKGERAAVGMPKTIVRVNEDAERRRRHRLRPHGPALERQIGRPPEGEQRLGGDIACDRADDPLRPAIEWIRRAVIGF